MAKQIEAQKEKSAKMMNVYISVVIACLCMIVFAHAAYLMNIDCLPMSKALTQSLMDITGFKDFSDYHPDGLRDTGRYGCRSSCVFPVV